MVVVVWMVVHMGVVVVVVVTTMVLVMVSMVMVVVTVDQVLALIVDHVGLVPQVGCCTVVTVPSFHSGVMTKGSLFPVQSSVHSAVNYKEKRKEVTKVIVKTMKGQSTKHHQQMQTIRYSCN